MHIENKMLGKNIHDQKILGLGAFKVNHPYAKAYLMECSQCKKQYGANSCDLHSRKCPYCQNGKPSLLPL